MGFLDLTGPSYMKGTRILTMAKQPSSLNSKSNSKEVEAQSPLFEKRLSISSSECKCYRITYIGRTMMQLMSLHILLDQLLCPSSPQLGEHRCTM